MNSVERAALLCLAAMLLMSPVVAARDAPADPGATVAPLAVLILPPDLRTTAATDAGYDEANFEVSSADHQLNIKVVNVPLLGGSRSDRQTEAARIAGVVERQMAGRPEFKDVMVIHVDYIKRSGDDSSVVQSIDFRRTPNGNFALHLS